MFTVFVEMYVQLHGIQGCIWALVNGVIGIYEAPDVGADIQIN